MTQGQSNDTAIHVDFIPAKRFGEYEYMATWEDFEAWGRTKAGARQRLRCNVQRGICAEVESE